MNRKQKGEKKIVSHAKGPLRVQQYESHAFTRIFPHLFVGHNMNGNLYIGRGRF